MPRARQVGITTEMRDKILRVDRLPSIVRTNLRYDCREILRKECEDINWVLTESPKAFIGMRSHRFWFPLEAIMPSDPKRYVSTGIESQDILLTIEWLNGMIANLEFIKGSILTYGLGYTKR